MKVNLDHLTKGQRDLLLRHIELFRSDPKLDSILNDVERMKKIQEIIQGGGSLADDIDASMLAMYIANTYTGKDEDLEEYFLSLGLPKNFE